MNQIDRGADRCIAAFGAQIGEIIRGFDHTDLLPLDSAEIARKDAAQRVETALLPGGTSFLKLPYSKQWAAMKTIVDAAQQPKIAADIDALGLRLEVARISRWFDLYGKKLGLTGSAPTDRSAQNLDAWHNAWGTLLVQVRAAFDDATNAEHTRVHELLLSAYEEQAAAERREEVKKSRKSSKTDATA